MLSVNRKISPVLWSIVGNLGKILSQAVYFVIIARLLGVEQYGIFASIFAFVNLFIPFSTLGFGNLLVMNVARDREKFGEFFGACILIICILGCFLSIISAFLGGIFYGWDLMLIIFIIALSELVFFRFVDICSQSFQSHENMRAASLIYLFSSFIRLIFALCASLMGIHDVLNWTLFYLVSNFIVGAISIYISWHKIGVPVFNFSVIRRNINQGAPYAFGIVSNSVYSDIDKILLLRHSLTSVSGEYNAAYRFILIALAPIQAIIYALNTTMFRKGENGIKPLLAMGKKILFLIIILFCIISTIYILIGRNLLSILGNEYQGSFKMLLMMLPLIFLAAINNLVGDLLMGAGYQKNRASLQVVIALTAVILGLFLIPLYGWQGALTTALLAQAFMLILLVREMFKALRRVDNV